MVINLKLFTTFINFEFFMCYTFWDNSIHNIEYICKQNKHRIIEKYYYTELI